jgi:hypothetical protein
MKYMDNNSSFPNLNPPNTKTLGDGLDDLKFEFRPRHDIYFTLFQNILTDSGAHPPFFIGFRVSFPKLQPTGRDVHSPPSSSDIKNKWIYTPTPHTWHRSG